MKYIRNDLSEIRYFEFDIKISDWIDLTQYRLMTDEEILKHETKPESIFHTVWDEENAVWLDPRTEAEKLAYKRSKYPKLTRYQFMRGLLEMGFKSSDIEAQIMLIEDEYTRELTMLGFKDAGHFERNDPSVAVMRDLLGKTDLEIDEFWELCVTF